MLVSGRVIAFLFVFGAKIVDFFATLMMRSLFYSLKKTIKTHLAKRRKKILWALQRLWRVRASVRIPPVRRTRALLTAIGWIDPNCSSWPGFSEHFLGGTLVGSVWFHPAEKNSGGLEFFLIVLYCMNILNVSKHMQARLPTKTVEYQRLSKIVFCRKV